MVLKKPIYIPNHAHFRKEITLWLLEVCELGVLEMRRSSYHTSLAD